MDKHYKRLVELVIKMHLEQATEDGTYNPQGSELEAILLAHQIDRTEQRRNALIAKLKSGRSSGKTPDNKYQLNLNTYA